MKTNIKLEKDAAKAKIKEKRIVGRENALKRFDEAVLRISNLKDKVSAQVEKFVAKGVDTASAEDFVATAETKLSEAKAKIIEANALFSVSIDELTAENKTALKTLVKDIETLIRNAHKALNDGIKALKDAARVKMEADTSAISTTEVNQ